MRSERLWLRNQNLSRFETKIKPAKSNFCFFPLLTAAWRCARSCDNLTERQRCRPSLFCSNQIFVRCELSECVEFIGIIWEVTPDELFVIACINFDCVSFNFTTGSTELFIHVFGKFISKDLCRILTNFLLFVVFIICQAF